eukprot:6402502-Amphidinium_carterae.1
MLPAFAPCAKEKASFWWVPDFASAGLGGEHQRLRRVFHQGHAAKPDTFDNPYKLMRVGQIAP